MLSRRQLMNDKIVSAQGENLSLVNVKGSKLNALSVYGKSTQDGTPSPENPVTIVSAGDSGEINVTVSGKNLLNIGTVTFEKNKNFPVNILAGTYTFSAEVKSADTDSNHCLVMFRKNQQNIGTLSVNRVGRSSATITLNENANEILLCASAGFNESDGDTATFTDIQLEIGTVATAYEPYKTPQTLTLSTPGGLPGIPVSSGGNYTDENGQQWICDEIDLKRGVYVQYIKKIILDGTEGDWAEREDFAYGFYTGELMTKAICNYFSSAQSINDIGQTESIYAIASTLLVFTYLSAQDLDEWKIWLSQHPVTVYYALATPIETDLTAEEIAAYKALHTYTPNTTVSNDADAGVKIGYREYKN